MTPVFDREKRILGYLEEVPYPPGISFKMVASSSISFREILNHPNGTIPIPECYFEWALMGWSRSSDDSHFCDVLIAHNPECLNGIRGFKAFAEVHGKPVESTRKYA